VGVLRSPCGARWDGIRQDSSLMPADGLPQSCPMAAGVLWWWWGGRERERERKRERERECVREEGLEC
jgi:hypothetical protein